jgi:high-affinity iron transporter
MVGEQAQEMQLAHWIGTTPIRWLENRIPAWAGMWFAVFPTYQTIIAQALAALVVVGSYYAARGLADAPVAPVDPVKSDATRQVSSLQAITR